MNVKFWPQKDKGITQADVEQIQSHQDSTIDALPINREGFATEKAHFNLTKDSKRSMRKLSLYAKPSHSWENTDFSNFLKHTFS